MSRVERAPAAPSSSPTPDSSAPSTATPLGPITETVSDGMDSSVTVESSSTSIRSPRLLAYLARERERLRCPEALQHGPADGRGRCPWCHKKYADDVGRLIGTSTPTTRDAAYEYYYDPDFGSDRGDVYTSERPV